MRVRTSPGFWLDAGALSAKDYKKFVATFQHGLTAPGHAAFVDRLAKAKSA